MSSGRQLIPPLQYSRPLGDLRSMGPPIRPPSPLASCPLHHRSVPLRTSVCAHRLRLVFSKALVACSGVLLFWSSRVLYHRLLPHGNVGIRSWNKFHGSFSRQHTLDDRPYYGGAPTSVHALFPSKSPREVRLTPDDYHGQILGFKGSALPHLHFDFGSDFRAF